MSAKTIKTRIQEKRNTTAYWNGARGFIPLDGEIIIYTDHIDRGEGQNPRYIPGIKIGDGNAYIQDLPFIDEDTRERLLSHIADMRAHITPEERNFWNNKLNVDDNAEVIGEVLILNRN